MTKTAVEDEAARKVRSRALLSRSIDAIDYLDRFETLYREASTGDAVVSWADLVPNPTLLAWLADRVPPRAGQRALDVGCGYGDNTAALAAAGYTVDGFDVSETAVERARERFGSLARFQAADAAAPPTSWHRAFDLVVEIYTLQVLPPRLRIPTAAALGDLVAEGGTLFLLARGRDDDQEPGPSLPWPLSRAEIASFATDTLRLTSFEDFVDDEDPPVRRFLAIFER